MHGSLRHSRRGVGAVGLALLLLLLAAISVGAATSEALGGKGGGGRADMAQAGGPDAGKVGEAFAAIRGVLGTERARN